MSKYELNFAPIGLTGETATLIGRQPYNLDRLNELKSEFADSHVFRRDGFNDSIIDIPIIAGRDPIGNIQEEVDLRYQHWLLPTLLSAALIRAFSGTRDILSDRPVAVVGATSKGLVRDVELPDWIQKRTLLKFDTRTIFGADNKPMLGLVCEARLKNFINGTCADLIALGVSPIGRYVQIEETAYAPQLLKRRRLIGRVADIKNGKLVLDDHAEGYEEISADVVFLEARREIFDDCIKQILGNRAARFLTDVESKAAEFHSGPGRLGQIQEALKYLRDKAKLEAVPGAKFTFEELLSSNDGRFPKTETIAKPTLVFDPSSLRKDDWNERGLKKNGPYDQRTFSPKNLRIAVICQANHEGQVDRFIAKFLDGMPEVLTGQYARYGDGFLRRFNLDKPSVTFFTAKSPSATDYLGASREALAQASDEGFKWDLALVQVEEEFKKTEGGDNPYFATKSVFLKRDIPVQSVRLETMAQPDKNLVFSMNHMSLATYAKLGGTPWLLAAKQTTAHELVIGLGSHSVSRSRLGTSQRYVGITTVFSSDGSYLLSDRTAVVPFEEYADALYETLKRSITTVRKQDNWRNTDKVRLVFHMFKPPKDTEAEAIKRTVENLDLDDVTFAFVHVAPNQPYLIFDHSQHGIGNRDPKKGVLGPPRGLHLRLGNRESLLVFSGASELKQASDGMPRPCLLKLHYLSTFKDMTYLARQAFEFSGHSWRMLSPEPYPITIRYSDLIAERLSGLSQVASWDPEAVRFGQIGRTLWFL